MNKLTRYISSQFKNPGGVGGWIITLVQNVVNSAMYQKTVELVNTGAEDKLLDIGYGNGHLLQKIYGKCASDLYGVDISDDARKMAEKKNQKAAEAGKLHLQVGDCCSLPYEEEMFSAVTTINTVYFWEDTVKGLSEIRRCLKTGKSFYNVVYTKEYLDTIKYTQTGYKKFSPEELTEYGKDAGFEKTEVRDIVKEKSFVVIYTK